MMVEFGDNQGGGRASARSGVAANFGLELKLSASMARVELIGHDVKLKSTTDRHRCDQGSVDGLCQKAMSAALDIVIWRRILLTLLVLGIGLFRGAFGFLSVFRLSEPVGDGGADDFFHDATHPLFSGNAAMLERCGFLPRPGNDHLRLDSMPVADQGPIVSGAQVTPEAWYIKELNSRTPQLADQGGKSRKFIKGVTPR